MGGKITPAIGDDPEAAYEGLRLCAKGVQIPEGAVNEHDRLTLAALEVVERCLIDLDGADLGATRFRLTSCVREGRRLSGLQRAGRGAGRAEREQRNQDQRET